MLITHLGMGGAEKVFNDHAKAFTPFFEVEECVFSRNHIEPSMITGNPLLELDENPPGGSLKRFLYRKRRLSSIAAARQSKVCVSHMEGPNILNCVTSLGKCKKILCVHGSIMRDSAKSPVKKWLLNRVILPFAYAKADAIVTVSQKMRKEVLSLGLNAQKVHAIPNFFDIDQIKIKAKESLDIYHELFASKKILLHVGRLSRQKNQRVLLDVIAAYKSSDRSTKLCIIGDGELKNDLLQRAKELQLSVYDAAQQTPLHLDYDVYFLGKQSNPYKFMTASKLFLLSSFFEGFPLVLGESLACDLPIISVNCETGPEELLLMDAAAKTIPKDQPYEADCGMLMPDWYTDSLTLEQTKMWTDAIAIMLNNTEKYDRLKQNCAVKIRQFGKDNIINYWKNLIEDVIHGK